VFLIPVWVHSVSTGHLAVHTNYTALLSGRSVGSHLVYSPVTGRGIYALPEAISLFTNQKTWRQKSDVSA
jgi:hypothetical protein